MSSENNQSGNQTNNSVVVGSTNLLTLGCVEKTVAKKELMPGVFKYTSNYSMSQGMLPQIQNIIVYKNFSVSIDFHCKGKLERIYQSLDIVAKSLLVNTSYVNYIRNMPIAGVFSQGNKVIIMDANALEDLYYLHHIYNPISCSASTLILKAAFDLYKLKHEEQAREYRERMAIDLEVWNEYSAEDTQLLSSYALNKDVALYSQEQIEQLKAAELKRIISESTSENRQDFLNEAVEFQLFNSMSNDLNFWNPRFVQERSYDKKHQEVAQMLDDPDQCLNYLNTTYPLIYPAVVTVMERINSTITDFENERGRTLYYKTVSWTGSALNYTTNLFGIKVLKFGSGAAAGIAKLIGFFGEQSNDNLGIIIATSRATGLGLLTLDFAKMITNDYLLPAKKVSINHEELIKHFTCKFTLSNGNKRLGDLDEANLKIVADAFAKHIYLAITHDSSEYNSQSDHTNYLLEQLSNDTHIVARGLDGEFNSSIFNINTNETIIMRDLIGHYNESACFDNIIY